MDQAYEMNEYAQPVINPTDLVIPILGTTGAGKSSLISLLTKEKVDIGHGLMSCESSDYLLVDSC